MGNEASGAYEAFMQSATEGMKKLGLAATDSSGKLLPMMTLLQEMQGKYGKSIEGNAKAQADLNAAFGTGALVVSQLYGNTAQLETSMRELGGSDSMRRAMDMAAAQASTMDRLNKTYEAIRITIGETLLPEFNKLAGGAEDTAKTFERWMTLFPNIAHVIGLVATAAIASAGAFAVWKVSVGLLSIALWPLSGLLKLLTYKMVEATTAQRLMAVWTKITGAVMFVWNGILKVARLALDAYKIATFSAALATNGLIWPVTLAVVAIAALAFGAYELYKHWDELNAAIANTAAWQALVAAANWVGESFAALWQWIVQGWDWLVAAFGNFSLTGVFTSMIESIKGLFSGLWEWIKSSFSGAWNWIAEKLNNIPGINLDVSAPATPQPVPNTLSTGTDLQGIAPGGIGGQINNNKSAVDKSKHIGQVNIYPQQSMTPAQLMEWGELQPL
jgi:phage-related protein